MGVLGSTPLIPHHKAGRIRILAFTSRERFAAMPEIPTLHESGFAGFETSQWLGLFVPRGTPENVIARVHAESAKALALQDVQGAACPGCVAAGRQHARASSPRVIRADIERWGKLIQELGIQPQ